MTNLRVSALDWTAVLDALPEPGHVVLPGFLPLPLVTALRDELRALDAAGQFHAAGIGRGVSQQVQRQIRGDRIRWLEEQSAMPAASEYLAIMDDLRQTLNREYFLGLAEYEAHTPAMSRVAAMVVMSTATPTRPARGGASA